MLGCLLFILVIYWLGCLLVSWSDYSLSSYFLTYLLHNLYIGLLICSLLFYISGYWFTLFTCWLIYSHFYQPAHLFGCLVIYCLHGRCNDLFAYLCTPLFIVFIYFIISSTHSLFIWLTIYIYLYIPISFIIRFLLFFWYIYCLHLFIELVIYDLYILDSYVLCRMVIYYI